MFCEINTLKAYNGGGSKTFISYKLYVVTCSRLRARLYVRARCVCSRKCFRFNWQTVNYLPRLYKYARTSSQTYYTRMRCERASYATRVWWFFCHNSIKMEATLLLLLLLCQRCEVSYMLALNERASSERKEHPQRNVTKLRITTRSLHTRTNSCFNNLRSTTRKTVRKRPTMRFNNKFENRCLIK